MKYSIFHVGKAIIHVVGGAMNDDLKEHLDDIADWFVRNDITMLWGDSYEASQDNNHPCKLLADKIKERGGNKPIRVLQLGNNYEQSIDASIDSSLIVTDESGKTIGYYDTAVKDEYMIYTEQQQDRQKAYYNNADGLMALNGGIGVGYEIVNSLLYTLSGDLPEHFRIMVIDNDEKFKKLMDSYIGLLGGNAPMLEARFFRDYYASAGDFIEHMFDEEVSI